MRGMLSMRRVAGGAGALLVAVMAAAPLSAQSSINPEVGLLLHGLELRLRVPGADSTRWYRGHAVFVHGSCTWFELDHAGWEGHHLVRRAHVPRRERVVVPLRSVVAFRVAPSPLGGGSVDSTAWTAISADSVRAKEPRRCLKE